jgi:hypothetical protein
MRNFAVPAAIATLCGIGINVVGNSLQEVWPNAPHLVWLIIFIFGVLMTMALPIWLIWEFVFPVVGLRPTPAEMIAMAPNQSNSGSAPSRTLVDAETFFSPTVTQGPSPSGWKEDFNIWLPNAAHYIICRKWLGKSERNESAEALLIGMSTALGEIRKEAGKGRLQIEGKSDAHGLPKIIPAEFWDDHQFSLQSALAKASLATTEKHPHAPSADNIRYAELKVKKSQVEAIWPSASI